MPVADIHNILDGAPPNVDWGVVVLDRESSEVYRRAPDRPFQAASLGKLGIAYALTATEGRSDTAFWRQELELRDTDRLPGTGILQHFPTGHPVTPEQAALLMIKESDNTAARLLVTTFGGAEAVNAQLAASPLGLQTTRLEIREGGRFAFGQTTPAEAAVLLRELSHGPLADALHQTNMWYGLCRDIQPRPGLQGVRIAALNRIICHAGKGRDAAPFIYEMALNREYPTGTYAHKGGSLEGQRHDTAVIEGHTVAALSTGYDSALPHSRRHPAHDIHAGIGRALVENV
jgi:beta-lactamase class A